MSAAMPGPTSILYPRFDHPAIEGLWLATGHEGLGITTSLGTAELLAAMIAGRESEITAEPYSPSRRFAAHH